MAYTLIITAINNPRSKSVLARHLAADPNVSLSKATHMLEQLPLVYARDLNRTETSQQIRYLHKLGTEFKVVESKSKVETPHAAAPEPEKKKLVSARRISLTRPVRLGEKKEQRRVHGSAAPGGGRLRCPKNIAKAVVLFAFLAGLAYVLSRTKGKDFRISRTDPLGGSEESGRRRALELLWDDDSDKSGNADSIRTRAPDSLLEKSFAYADSARSAGLDAERAVRFYRIALSFNRKNANAWYGLINAYRAAGQEDLAARAEQDMRELFGEEILSIQKIVAPYGSVEEFERGRDGIFRLKYHTRSRGARVLAQETYLIMRALKPTCECRAFSVFASTGSGGGMLAHLKAEPFPLSQSAYEREARITHAE
ncbi:MAG: hypothetical protein GF418_05485 [Chitinivibrionales bacterium]|nr:hypothetical protein [Chitinivibrionales bacterium]MBD3395064.1 hypothetical protein [Chitinivibrionales bacterium]